MRRGAAQRQQAAAGGPDFTREHQIILLPDICPAGQLGFGQGEGQARRPLKDGRRDRQLPEPRAVRACRVAKRRTRLRPRRHNRNQPDRHRIGDRKHRPGAEPWGGIHRNRMQIKPHTRLACPPQARPRTGPLPAYTDAERLGHGSNTPGLGQDYPTDLTLGHKEAFQQVRSAPDFNADRRDPGRRLKIHIQIDRLWHKAAQGEPAVCVTKRHGKVKLPMPFRPRAKPVQRASTRAPRRFGHLITGRTAQQVSTCAPMPPALQDADQGLKP